ncbi:hypothetical protein KY284_027121 [Solanum tuberosum]|nr:hypothetical protein KY284_027121 [Solanum tuberosum]
MNLKIWQCCTITFRFLFNSFQLLVATIAYKSDDEYSTITYKGDIGFIDFDKYKSAYSYNPNEESDIVVISVPFPLIEGKPKSGFVGETVVDSITIENTTDETVDLWSIKIYDSKPEDSFTLSLMKPPTACSDLQYVEEFMESFSLEDRMLQPGRPLTVWLTCKPKEIGLHTSAVHFNVGDDNIERLVFVLAEDKVSQSLASSWPFHRNRRKKAPAVDVGFVGGSRPMRDSYSIFRHKLLSYPIPRDVRQMIEKKQFPDVIGEGLRRDNYVAYFRTLLAIEEIKMEEDMRDYDMESVTMKRRGPHFLSLHVPGLAERRPSLVDGDHIFAKLATTYASEIITPYQCYIHRVEAEEVFLKFDKEFHDNHVGRNLYNVQFAFNRMGVRRLHQAIEATESLDGEILFPSVISSTRNIQAAVLAPLSSCMLNKEQTSAVEKILGCEGGAPYVIHGPPGTGKTRTLIEAIIQLHIMRKDARVLVCAPSNSAADHILEKLVSQQNVEVQEHEIFRLNALTRLLDDVNPSCLWFCNVEDNAFKCPLLRELRRYRIIISTYASAFLLYAQGIKRGHLSHIFLDEAGQASEPDTMIPLSHLLRKETVVVLAGDPRQLGPVVFSKDAESRLRFLSSQLLSKFMQAPSQVHLGVAKRTLRYIKRTADYGIWFKREEQGQLMGYSDSDWANSKKQDVVAQSSAEAEYIAAAGATNQALWLRKILCDLEQNDIEATIIKVDNKSSISMAKNPVQHGRSKHINVKFHAIRQAEKDGKVQLVHCSSDLQIADIMTKALPKGKFEVLRAKLGVSKKNLKEEC